MGSEAIPVEGLPGDHKRDGPSGTVGPNPVEYDARLNSAVCQYRLLELEEGHGRSSVRMFEKPVGRLQTDVWCKRHTTGGRSGPMS